jgi:hypothetical protein
MAFYSPKVSHLFVTAETRNILHIRRYVYDLSKYFAQTSTYKYGHNAKLRVYRHFNFLEPSVLDAHLI